MINTKNSVSVTDFGAVSASSELQTKAFQDAFDKIFLMGGGRVTVPEGTYYIGGVRIRSNTTLYLCKGAKIIASRDPNDYFCLQNDTVEPLSEEYFTNVVWSSPRHPESFDDAFLNTVGSSWNNAVFRAVFAENICIFGEEGSVIDGCNTYDPVGEERYRGPHGFNMFYCKNVHFEGYTVKNTGNWAHCMQRSENLSFKNITVEGGHDGVHNRKCRNVTVEDCKFYTGDDCVAGFANRNVTVRNCIMNTACSGLRMGGSDILIENCHFFGPAKYLFRGSLSLEEKISGALHSEIGRRNMLSMFTYFADKTLSIEETPENIVIRNCKVESSDRFIHYNFSGNETWQLGTPLKSLFIENVSAQNLRLPLTAYGSADLPLTLEISDVDISFAQDAEDVPFMHAANVKSLKLKNVNVSKSAKTPFIKSWGAVESTVFENVSSTGGEEIAVTLTDEKFVCKAI